MKLGDNCCNLVHFIVFEKLVLLLKLMSSNRSKVLPSIRSEVNSKDILFNDI